MFLCEQMMNSVDKNLQVFLKEHKVNLIAEMAELAEQYHQAHVFSTRQIHLKLELITCPVYISKLFQEILIMSISNERKVYW